ncbi:MAG: hypothetical protein KDB82_09995 [Planctomycetes bacterium]|nr:hypothetical protein [Planctomycetota bacterium]
MLEYATTHDDPNGALSRWVLDAARRANSDDGRLYARVSEAGGDYTVSLYSDAARTQLVARGSITGDSGDVILTEQNSSGLSGSMRLRNATALDAVVDAFYADDDDLTALQKEVASFLINGEFAGRPGFAEPLARAKRVMDALLNARYPQGWRADSLAPLAEPASRYALFFIYDYLSTRADDAAAQLAAHWRREARLALPRVRLSLAGEATTPFVPRIQRS